MSAAATGEGAGAKPADRIVRAGVRTTGALLDLLRARGVRTGTFESWVATAKALPKIVKH
jgi:hypothetical protein